MIFEEKKRREKSRDEMKEKGGKMKGKRGKEGRRKSSPRLECDSALGGGACSPRLTNLSSILGFTWWKKNNDHRITAT